MKLNLTKDWYERNIEKKEETMNLDAAIAESIRISRSDVGYSYEKMQFVACICILAGEVERLQTNIERLESEIKQANKEIDRLEKTVHKYKTGGLRR